MKKKIFAIVLIVFVIMACFLCIKILNKSEEKESDVGENPSETELAVQKEEKEKIVVELPYKKDSHITLSAIGDIMCHNSQYIDAFDSSQNTYNFSYVFDDIKEKISSADIAIGNLETTFAGSEKGYSNYPRFNTPEQLAFNLKDAGIDILTTANNHCMDTNYAGLESTLNFLDQAQISHTGTNRSLDEQNTILIKEVNDIKIAFLAFTYDTNGIQIPQDKSFAVNLIDENFMKAQIDLAKKQNPDLICVSMHWGIEYQNKQNATQENLANFLFQNGVDIILGSHPHVLQPMEKRSVVLENGKTKECFVIYSFGNFMSAQTQTNTRSSIILNIDINKKAYTNEIKIENISYTPIYMYRGNLDGKKYKVLDMEKSVTNYETGVDGRIGDVNYSFMKSEIERIRNLMGQ